MNSTMKYFLIYRIFPVQRNKYDKKAGYIRNEEMSKNADALIAFWDSISKGIKQTIDIANKKLISCNH